MRHRQDGNYFDRVRVCSRRERDRGDEREDEARRCGTEYIQRRRGPAMETKSKGEAGERVAASRSVVCDVVCGCDE